MLVINNLMLMLKIQMTFELLDVKHTNDILAIGCSGISAGKWKMPKVKHWLNFFYNSVNGSCNLLWLKL